MTWRRGSSSALLGAACSLVTLNSVAATSTERLAAACARKTDNYEHVSGKLQKVGESLDSYCEGYLTGVFDTLHVQGAVCVKDDPPRPEYLASVFQTYIGADTARKKAPAIEVVREAFGRAFACTDSKSR